MAREDRRERYLDLQCYLARCYQLILYPTIYYLPPSLFLLPFLPLFLSLYPSLSYSHSLSPSVCVYPTLSYRPYNPLHFTRSTWTFLPFSTSSVWPSLSLYFFHFPFFSNHPHSCYYQISAESLYRSAAHRFPRERVNEKRAFPCCLGWKGKGERERLCSPGGRRRRNGSAVNNKLFAFLHRIYSFLTFNPLKISSFPTCYVYYASSSPFRPFSFCGVEDYDLRPSNVKK